MRLVIQHPHRQGEISGVLTSIQELMPELLARAGLEVRVISSRESSVGQRIADVLWADAVMLNSNGLGMAVAARLLCKPVLLKLHYLQYQTVHTEYMPMSFARRMHTELQHLWRLRSGARYFAESLGRLALRTLTALVVSRVAACSGFCAEQSALPRKVSVLRNPMRVTAGLPSREPAALDRPWRFVFIGRITRDKGWDTLVEAAGRVASAGRDFRVDVIGDGADLRTMQDAVGRDGLREHFRFAGRLSPDATLAALPGALAAVMPSRFQEPAGYIPLEAASQRVPSIVARVGGLPETAGPPCPAFTAGRADELAQIMLAWLDAPAAACSAGHAAYLRALELYSPETVANDLLRTLGFPDVRPMRDGLRATAPPFDTNDPDRSPSRAQDASC